jgi:two-component system, NtrC family, response regulator AtoC
MPLMPPTASPWVVPLQSVLIVDDEPDILASLQTILEQHLPGTTVHAAPNGQDALAVLQREKVDVIVTDYKMPGMNGLQLLDEAARVAPGVPRILITAFPDLDVAIKAINEAGVEHFVTKPFRAEEVVEQIRAALLKRRVDRLMVDSFQQRGPKPA